jgi:hypothetical protein
LAGHAFQRFTPFFPGALTAALGPADTAPPLAWLESWIFEPPLPGLWAVHRCMTAMLLAERDPDNARRYAGPALETLNTVDPDPRVRRWIEERLRRLA